MGSNDLKRVGLIFTEEGAKDFKKTLQDINIEMNKNYNQFKLTQSQWDNSTKSTEKLKAQQEYLTNAYEIQSDKVNVLKMQLADLENAENKNTTAIKKKQNELTNAEIKLKNYESKLKDVQTQLTNTGKKLEEWGEKVEKSGKKIENAGKKLSAFSAASISALTLSAKNAIDFEDAFAGVEKTVDGTKEQMEELKQGIREMAKEIPSSTMEIAAVAEAAGQLGIKTENILDFSKAMIDLGNSTNLTADEAASQLAKFANITQMSQKDFDKLGSTIVDLGNKYATTEADIVSMAMRLAGAGKQVGLSEAEILGLATALSSVGIEAEMGGSAISKAMVKMQNAVEQGGTKLDAVLKKTGMTLRELELMSANDSMGFKELSQSIGMTSTEVKQLITAGTNLEDFASVSGMTAEEFKKAWKDDAAGALSAFIKGLGNAQDKGESAITMLSEMGLTEVRLRDSLLRAANAGTLFNDAINTGTQAWKSNAALTNEANKRYDTLKSKIKIAINKLKDMAITLGNKLMPSIEDLIKIFGNWIENFNKLSDKQVDMIVKIGLIVAAIGPLVTIIGKVTSVIGGTIKGIGTFTQAIGVARGKITSTSDAVNGLSKVITGVFSPTGIAITAAVAGIAILIDKTKKATEETKKQADMSEQVAEKVLKEKEAMNELRNSIDNNVQAELNHIDRTKELWNELQKITDENGKVKEGYEARARVITEELSSALDTEVTMTDNVIDKYKELQSEMDKLILKKKTEAIVNGYQEKYDNAMQRNEQDKQDLITAEENLKKAKKEEEKAYNEYQNKLKNSLAYGATLYDSYLTRVAEKNWKNTKTSLNNAQSAYDSLSTTVSENTRIIEDYNYVVTLSAEKTEEAYNKIVNMTKETYTENGKTVETAIARRIQAEQIQLRETKKINEEAIKNSNETQKKLTQTSIDNSNKRLEKLSKELIGMTSITMENSDDIKNAWTQLATNSYETYANIVKNAGPEMKNTIQNITGVIITNTPIVADATNGLANEFINSLSKNEEVRKSALELLNSYLTGLSDENKRKLLTDAGIKDVENVMRGLKEGDLSETVGIEILKGLGSGINNTYWKNQIFEKARTLAGSISNTLSAITGKKFSLLPGHKNGLDYVPRDDYVARLHKGERVLTAQENKEYSRAETTGKVSNNTQKEIKQEINYDKMASAFLKALNSCKLTLDEAGFAKIVKNELYEVL